MVEQQGSTVNKIFQSASSSTPSRYKKAQSTINHSNKVPKTACWYCGYFHFVRFCTYKRHRCNNCHNVGHKEGYCSTAATSAASNNRTKCST